MSFRMDKLTIKAQEAIVASQSKASEMGNPELDPLHLLHALLQDREGVVVPLLKKIGASIEKIQSVTESEMNRLPRSSGGRQPGVGPALQKVFEASASAATAMKDEFVSTEHLLLALCRSNNKATEVLKLLGIDENDILVLCSRCVVVCG